MPTSLLGRVLRPVTLLAAAMLLSQATLSVATPTTTAATTLTRTVSCAGLNFHPIDSRTTYRWEGPMLYRFDGQGDGWFLCDPNLPNKAKVTRIRFTVRDVLNQIDVRYCGLVRSGLGTSGGAPVAMGVIENTGLAAAPGIVRRSDSSISYATIDQTAYAYWLQCQIHFGAGLGGLGGPYGAIIGAEVTYRISSTNG